MIKAVEKLRASSWLRLTLVFFLAAAFLAMAGGELFAAAGVDDCEDHCEETCHGCGDCVFCLPLLHMLAGPGSYEAPADLSLHWTLASISAQLIRHPADDIDHPPQNLL